MSPPLPSLTAFYEEKAQEANLSGKINRGARGWRCWEQRVMQGESTEMLLKAHCSTSSRADESKKQLKGKRRQTETSTKEAEYIRPGEVWRKCI